MSEPIALADSTAVCRQLTVADAAAYQSLRLNALATEPEHFLSTLEFEQRYTPVFFEREVDPHTRPPGFGYYGVWADSATAGESQSGQQLQGYAKIEASVLPKQQHVGFFYNLYIVPAARGQGLARQLCTYVLHEVKQLTLVELIYLTCHPWNTPAQALYQSLGFRECGRRPKSIKWQGQYDDEVEFVLELGSK